MSDPSAEADAGLLFQQAVAAFSQQRFAEALPPLERAAASGHGEAQNLLGVMLLNGMAVTPDMRRAAALFEAAAAQGLKEAHYNLSNLLFHGIGTGQDEVRAQEQLLMAARAGHRPSLRSLGFVDHAPGKVDR